MSSYTLPVIYQDETVSAGTHTTVKKDCRTGNVVSTTHTQVDNLIMNRVVRGLKTPNFHRRKNSGELLRATTFSKFDSVSQIRDTVGSNTYTLGYGYTKSGPWMPKGVLGSVPTNLMPPLLTEEQMDLFGPSQDDLDGVVLNAAAMFEGDFMAMVFYAERKKAVDLVVNLIPRLQEALLRTSRYGGAKAAGWWLEAKFGWTPLYHDVKALWDLLNRPKRPMRETRTANRAYFPSSVNLLRSQTIPYSLTPSYGLSGYSGYEIAQEDTIVVSNVRGWVAMDHKVAPSRVTNNPFTSAWELLPYSWVVDYVLGVGDFLAAQSAVLGASAVTSSASYAVTVERTTRWTPVGPYLPNCTNGITHEVWSSATKVLRIPAGISNKPVYRTWSLDQLRNLLALLRQGGSARRGLRL